MEPITGDVEAFHHGLADLDALFAGRVARYANIDILKTSSAEEENILGNVALSPPAEEEDILATIKPCH
jgi:hypothetical protein